MTASRPPSCTAGDHRRGRRPGAARSRRAGARRRRRADRCQVAAAAAVGAELIDCPDAAALDTLVAAADIVCPAPGVAETHPVIDAAIALGKPLRTEIDLAYEWEQQRTGGPRPMLAVTGTDGKTTTTMMAAAMLQCAGLKAAAVGNTDVPLVAALDTDVDVFVVECSSFRLNWLDSFRTEASVWLNLAADHQNWHVSMAAYEQAKARMWRHNRPTDVAVGYAADPVVMRHLATVDRPALHVRIRRRRLPPRRIDTDGSRRAARSSARSMTRDLPHDVTNALAAAAITIESGLAGAAAVAEALADVRAPAAPHRADRRGRRGAAGTTTRRRRRRTRRSPRSAASARRAARRRPQQGPRPGQLGGRARTGAGRRRARRGRAAHPRRLRPVVSASSRSTSMDEAVAAAAAFAEPGDAVLLSPACASFDWYPDGGYPARGDDFQRLVREHFEEDAR